MFDGGFQLGVTVNAVDELPSDWPVPAGAVDRPSRLGEILPVGVRSDSELAGDLQRQLARGELSRETMRATLALAHATPSDRGASAWTDGASVTVTVPESGRPIVHFRVRVFGGDDVAVQVGRNSIGKVANIRANHILNRPLIAGRAGRFEEFDKEVASGGFHEKG